MKIGRRGFIGGAGAVVGSTLVPGIIQAADTRSGTTPISRAEWDAIIRRETGPGGFTCVRTAQATEGPFYYESSLLRKAIAEGRRGEPLRLGITLGGISTGTTCHALAGALVDIWHTDAAGLYSNVGKELQLVDTSGQTFMRGHQITDDKGYVEFDTIMPGWEIVPAAPPVLVAKRTTHIHVKVFHGRNVMTTQLFFPDPLLDQLYADVEPYKSHRLLGAPGVHGLQERIRNGDDRFYVDSNSQPMTVERINGVLTAKATIGVISEGDRGFATLFR